MDPVSGVLTWQLWQTGLSRLVFKIMASEHPMLVWMHSSLPQDFLSSCCVPGRVHIPGRIVVNKISTPSLPFPGTGVSWGMWADGLQR